MQRPKLKIQNNIFNTIKPIIPFRQHLQHLQYLKLLNTSIFLKYKNSFLSFQFNVSSKYISLYLYNGLFFELF